MVAAAVIGSAVIGAGASALSASKAAKAQTKASNAAQATELQMYNQNRTDLAPWREAGGRALGSLEGMLDPNYNLQTDPGYQFRFDEGMRGLEQSAAASGILGSGGTLKDILKYGQGYASDEYGNRWNRLAGLAGVGQTATNQTGMFGQNAANNIANYQTQAGNARAAGAIGVGNAIGGIGNTLAYGAGSGWFGGGAGASSPGSTLGPIWTPTGVY